MGWQYGKSTVQYDPAYSASRDLHARRARYPKFGHLFLDVPSRLKFAISFSTYAAGKYPYEGVAFFVKPRHGRLYNGRDRQPTYSARSIRRLYARIFVFFHDRQQRVSKPILVMDFLLGLSSGRQGVVAVEFELDSASRHVAHNGMSRSDYIFILIK